MIGKEATNFKLLIQLKFLFSLFRVILIICVYNTYEENLFRGLGSLVDRNSILFKEAWVIAFVGVLVTLFCMALDISIQLSGVTFNYNKVNIISKYNYNFRLYTSFIQCNSTYILYIRWMALYNNLVYMYR